MKKYGKDFDVELLSVDIHPKYKPTECTDILKWSYKKRIDDFLKKRRARDIVIAHASPPCTEYSRAKTTGVRDLNTADSLAKRSLRIMKYAKPTAWSFENPVGLLRERPFMQRLLKFRKTCSYCKYGKKYRKNTDIWTNLNVDLDRCTAETPCIQKAKTGVHPVTAQLGPSGSQPGSGVPENVYGLPSRLISHIYSRRALSL